MKYGIRMPDLGKSIAAKLSVNRMLKQQLGFGKGLMPDRKKSKYNKRYSKMSRKMSDIKSKPFSTQSDRVKEVQKKLKKIGLYKGKLSGILDGKTMKAIMLFQKKSGLDVNGILDIKTLTELNKTHKDESK